MMRWWWFCPALVVAVGGAIIYVRLLEALWDEAAAWQKATEPPKLAGYDDNPIPPEYVIGLPHWRKDGGP